MPQTVVQGPDGQKYTVNHPEGASEADIIAYAQENYGSAQKPRSMLDYAKGLYKSAEEGVTRGVTGAMALPRTIADQTQQLREIYDKKLQETLGPPPNKPDYQPSVAQQYWPSQKEIRSFYEGSLGGLPEYKPQNFPEKLTATGFEMLGSGGAAGGRTMLQRLGQIALPSLFSEGGGEIAHSVAPAAEPFVRAGGALVGQGAASKLAGPSRAENAIIDALRAGNISEAQAQQAQELFTRAANMGQPLSQADALAYVTGGGSKQLSDLQRVVEGQGGMGDYYANMSGKLKATADTQFAPFGAPNTAPTQMGPDIASVARQYVEQGTPQGQAVSQAVTAAGPRVTAEQAGQTIQPAMARTRQSLDEARAAQADIEYGAARAAEPTVPVYEHQTQDVVRVEPTAPPWPMGRDPETGRVFKKSPQQIKVEALEEPQPVGVMKRDEKGRMVRKTDEEIAAEQQVNLEALQQKQYERFRQTHRVEEGVPVVGGPTSYVQVNPTAAAKRIDQAIAGGEAKEAGTNYLERARKLLNDSEGNLDTSVNGMLSARQAMGDLIGEAERAGHGNSARLLKDVQSMLDATLESQVPMAGQARRNFAENSRPLDLFEQPGRVPGQITERAPGPPGSSAPFVPGQIPDASVAASQASRAAGEQRFTMPAEQVPGAVLGAGPSGVRDFLAAAKTPAERDALENHFVTQVLDQAGRQGVEVNAKTIRDAILKNEDMLKQMPGVRQKLEDVATQREGLDRVLQGTPIGKLVGKPDVDHAIDVLFKRDPRAQSEGEIKIAIDALRDRSPQLAKDLVQNYIRTKFEQFTRGAKTSPVGDQFGGAGFATGIRGNPQQRKNFEAALTSAYGPDVAKGFGQFLDVLEAQGMRQRPGSQTSFNTEILKELGRPGATSETAMAALFGGAGAAAGGGTGAVLGALRLPSKVSEMMSRMMLQKNINSIGDMLTKPELAKHFADLARAARGSQAADVVARIARISALSSTQNQDK